jgi:hypothetical protein
MKSTLDTTRSIRDLQSRLLIALLIGGYAPALMAAEETFFDRLKGFFSDTFESTTTEPPKDWALGACTELSEDAFEVMLARQAGDARSDVTKSALEQAAKRNWPKGAKSTPDKAYMGLVASAYAVDRSWLFFMREGIAEEFRDNTFAKCLSDLQ